MPFISNFILEINCFKLYIYIYYPKEDFLKTLFYFFQTSRMFPHFIYTPLYFCVSPFSLAPVVTVTTSPL